MSEYITIGDVDLNEIFNLEFIDDFYRKENFSTYDYFGLNVPRVSQILKSSINNDYLITWAAKVGYNRMNSIRDNATEIGTYVHEAIEYHLLNDYKDPDFSNINIFKLDKVKNAFDNFRLWMKSLNNQGYKIGKIIAIERKVACPFFAGTIDCICVINGKTYIIDFKTSKQISFDYVLQTCAYMWIVNNYCQNELPHIDGVGVIRIDKNKRNCFEDLFLNEFIPNQNSIINYAYNTFSAMLNNFYNVTNFNLAVDNYRNHYENYSNSLLI